MGASSTVAKRPTILFRVDRVVSVGGGLAVMKAGVCPAVVVVAEKTLTFVVAVDGTLNADTDTGTLEAKSSVVIVAAAIKSANLLVIPTMVSFVIHKGVVNQVDDAVLLCSYSTYNSCGATNCLVVFVVGLTVRLVDGRQEVVSRAGAITPTPVVASTSNRTT